MKKSISKNKFIYIFLVFIVLAGSAYILTPPVLFKYYNYNVYKKLNLDVKKLEYDNEHLEYVEGGKGETILFVHGFQSSKEYWIPYFKKYFKDYNIVALDLPSHGKSSSPKNQKYDLVSLSKSLEFFIEKKNLKNFHLIATSMGGGIATVYTHNNPDKVKSLVLVNPLGIDQEMKSDLQIMMERGENILFPNNLKEFNEMTIYVTGKHINLSSYFKKYALVQMMKRYPVYKRAFVELLTTSKPVDDILPKIETRSLIVMGQKDKIIHPNSYEYFVTLMPKAKAVRLKNGSHVLIEKYFDKASDAIGKFLKE